MLGDAAAGVRCAGLDIMFCVCDVFLTIVTELCKMELVVDHGLHELVTTGLATGLYCSCFVNNC